MRAHRSYRHEALLYRSGTGFLSAVVPFVREGLAAQQPVLVAVIEPRLRALESALGRDAEKVDLVDMAEVGSNPARIIPVWRNFIERACVDGRPARGIGEPVWAGRRDPEIDECYLHEGLLNIAVAPDTPLWLMCPYDVDALPDGVISEAHRSHPVVVESDQYRGSTAYGGAYHVANLFGEELEEPPPTAQSMTFTTENALEVPTFVAQRAARVGLAPERADILASAVTEIAADSARHASGGGTLRMWAAGPALICEVRDDAVVTNPMVGREVPTTMSHHQGLWRANQVCDLIQTRSNAAGTTVRVHTWF